MDVEKCAPFTKSPLDAWRGSGRIAKQLGLTRDKPFTVAEPPRGRELTRQVAAPKSSASLSPCPCGCDKVMEQIATIKVAIGLDPVPTKSRS